MCMYIYLSICLSIYLSIYLSMPPCMHVSHSKTFLEFRMPTWLFHAAAPCSHGRTKTPPSVGHFACRAAVSAEHWRCFKVPKDRLQEGP